ncbi:MAG: helix-turn-helix transcriptional regulator [Legionella sp.]|nr:helix-turn-helix transcriptional regulator [Legionella sp.]
MKKIDLTKQFAYRLRDAMLAANLNSQRSTSGVCIHKLAEITGYSVQICRRYLRGEALPEPVKLAEIAEKLNVSPGWLLFGDRPYDSNQIVINKSLLKYIFTHAADLYNASPNGEEVSDFLLALINDASQINASEDQSKKIIDLAMSSIKHFKL